MESEDIDNFETREIESLNSKKIIDISQRTFKQRVRSMFTSFVGQMIINFSTKLPWQFGLVTYLAIVCPFGTWDAIKFIIKLFQ